MTWPANCWIIILPWNVLLFSLEQQMNGELTPSKRWAHSKQTMRAHWTEFGDRLWTVNGEQTQSANGAPTQVKCERWTHGERYVNAIWMQNERFIPRALGLFLNACKCTVSALWTISANGVEQRTQMNTWWTTVSAWCMVYIILYIYIFKKVFSRR